MFFVSSRESSKDILLELDARVADGAVGENTTGLCNAAGVLVKDDVARVFDKLQKRSV